jgi:hypothetical protein
LRAADPEQSKAKQSKAKQSKAKQSKAKQSKAKQSKSKTTERAVPSAPPSQRCFAETVPECADTRR